MLERAGHAVSNAASGEEAVSVLKGGLKPDLVITDFHMGAMNGIELVREVRKMSNLRFIPVLMVTTDLAGEAPRGQSGRSHRMVGQTGSAGRSPAGHQTGRARRMIAITDIKPTGKDPDRLGIGPFVQRCGRDAGWTVDRSATQRPDVVDRGIRRRIGDRMRRRIQNTRRLGLATSPERRPVWPGTSYPADRQRWRLDRGRIGCCRSCGRRRLHPIAAGQFDATAAKVLKVTAELGQYSELLGILRDQVGNVSSETEAAASGVPAAAVPGSTCGHAIPRSPPMQRTRRLPTSRRTTLPSSQPPSPEPMSLALLGAGLVSLCLVRRRSGA